MKLFIKSLSTLLAVLMLLGSFSVIFTVFAAAADAKAAEPNQDAEAEKTPESIDYTKEVFQSPEDALQYMVPLLNSPNENLTMYFNEFTGAFAVKNNKTGQITFSNPYDVASSKGSEKTKNDLLSQIIVKYSDNSNGQSAELTSYADAAKNEQIKVKPIKGGVRVEYIIGNEATRKLIPRVLSADNYVKLLFLPMQEAIGSEHYFSTFKSYYKLWDYDGQCEYYNYDGQQIFRKEPTANSTKLGWIAMYPVVEDKDIVVLDTTLATAELNKLEMYIKDYCPDYTFDQLDADHAEMGYEAENELSPVFKMALEYTLNNDGFTVRQPTNGLRYNTTLYTIESIDILPWMGAGNSYNEGYTFYPDGSGALFRFEELNGKSTFTASRMIYGNDFAYHYINAKYQKALRMPVFGIKSDDGFFTYKVTATVKNEDGTQSLKDLEKRVSVTVIHTEEELEEMLEQQVKENKIVGYSDIKLVTESNGFFAVIEEGESLCTLATYHAGALSDFHTIKTSFNPRPKDTYNLGDSISVSGSQSMTVVSDRKYTGNLKIHYVLLSDETLAAETGFGEDAGYYKADYIGMANAYSDYLLSRDLLTRLTEEDVNADIPLYIESFGMIEVTEQIMSFPVTVDKPLTTFDDIWTMYDELSTQGIKNINFRLNGFANGGMASVVPTKIKWEKAVGGKKGMLALLEKAQNVNETTDGNLKLFPEFELSYVQRTAAFDGLSLKRDVIRTIDNRYASQREYSATYQEWVSYFNLALSPAYIDRFYNKLLDAYEDYTEFGALGISVSTLGSDLNTDFDEDEPYNREDNKGFIKEALEAISTKEGMAGVMADGGNAYTYKYMDHMLNVALDSSRYMKASNSVPFVGMVLHGYVQFAGDPLNMEGDIDYAMLKAIENGASMYFILSYRNTNYLKEFYDLSQYYSVNYAIWKEDVIKYYTELNNVMKDVQTSLIINHEFLTGTRVLDVSEIETAIRNELLENDAYETEYDKITWLEQMGEIAEARIAAKLAVETMKETLDDLNSEYVGSTIDAYQTLSNRVDDAVEAYEHYLDGLYSGLDNDRLQARYNDFLSMKDSAIAAALEGLQLVIDATALYDGAVELLDTARSAIPLLEAINAPQELIDDANTRAQEAEKSLQDIEKAINQCKGFYELMFTEIMKVNGVTRESIEERLNFDVEDDEEVEEEELDSIYVSDNGNIVAVTYGGKDGVDSAAYKTFILNYNNYAVTVKYQVGDVVKTYTIPANRYVVVMH